MLPPLKRREFLAGTTAATAAALAGSSRASGPRPLNPVPRGATDTVPLGESGVEVSVIGVGTGSNGVGQASNQTRLGLKEFCRLYRHAFDSGIRFFDVADQYGSHTYVREALKGLPRDQYVIQTKTHATTYENARSHVERYRMELGIDHIDILLLHCMTTADWAEKHAGAMDYIREAREQGLVRAHGVSCHGMDPLRTAATEPFVQVDLARINPEGAVMDSGDPEEVAAELARMHEAGKGVIGMKICGEGRFKEPERRDASLRYVFGLGTVDAIVVGIESLDQVDDLVARTDRALDHVRTQRA